jgi:primase-polymerase (primpol)-like protein
MSVSVSPPPAIESAPPPQFIRPNFENLPADLKQRPNWLLWVPVSTGSKWTKRPILPSGFAASTTKPQHWTSFDDVKQAYERAVDRGYIEVREKGKPTQRIPIGGIGFVFDGHPDENGLVFAGADFDGVIPREGGISSVAAERVKRVGSYVEASVSGTGLHVILKARPLASGVAHNGIELYTSGRFFTMTGHTGKTARPIIPAPDAFATLAEELRA